MISSTWSAGKTSVTQAASESLKAVLLRSPPTCISQWRKAFDDEPTIVRRAFYSLGNYIVASEIAEESAKAPVIVDRWVHDGFGILFPPHKRVCVCTACTYTSVFMSDPAS